MSTLGSVAYQPSGLHGDAIRISRRILVTRGQGDQLLVAALEKTVGRDKEDGVRAFVSEALEDRVDLMARACLENLGP
jgi:hypothetical protein